MQKYYFIATFLLLIGCRGNNSKLYGVNPLGYVNIVFSDCKLENGYLMAYKDTVINKTEIIPDSINFKFFENGVPASNERVVHFSEEPEEWYVVSFAVSQPWIKYIYNQRLDAMNMIREKKLLSNEDVLRVRSRFGDAVIKPAEVWGLNNHIPDSVMYR